MEMFELQQVESIQHQLLRRLWRALGRFSGSQHCTSEPTRPKAAQASDKISQSFAEKTVPEKDLHQLVARGALEWARLGRGVSRRQWISSTTHNLAKTELFRGKPGDQSNPSLRREKARGNKASKASQRLRLLHGWPAQRRKLRQLQQLQQLHNPKSKQNCRSLWLRWTRRRTPWTQTFKICPKRLRNCRIKVLLDVCGSQSWRCQDLSRGQEGPCQPSRIMETVLGCSHHYMERLPGGLRQRGQEVRRTNRTGQDKSCDRPGSSAGRGRFTRERLDDGSSKPSSKLLLCSLLAGPVARTFLLAANGPMARVDHFWNGPTPSFLSEWQAVCNGLDLAFDLGSWTGQELPSLMHILCPQLITVLEFAIKSTLRSPFVLKMMICTFSSTTVLA